MNDADPLDWPFFEEPHRVLAANVRAWCAQHLRDSSRLEERTAVDARCRQLVAQLGAAGFIRYCVRASDGGAVEPEDPGFEVESRIDVIAPHPLARLRFKGCHVPAGRLIGAEGEGFKIAISTRARTKCRNSSLRASFSSKRRKAEP